MRADQRHLVSMVPLQLPQPLLVSVARLAVVLVDVLEEPESGRAAPRCLDLAVVEERVPAVEQPAVGRVDGDAAVAGGVAGQRDHRDLRVDAGEEADALEAEPAVAAGAMLDPDRLLAPLPADGARPLRQGRRPSRGPLGREDVDLRVREVADAPGVVEVQVSRDDMADVRRVVSERLDLADRRLALVADRRCQGAKRQAEAAGIGAIAEAEPRVEQDQLTSGLDQKAVSDHLGRSQEAAVAGQQARPPRAERSAIEVADLDATEPIDSPNPDTPAMNDQPDLAAAGREIIDSNLYMVLATADRSGQPWASPVYFAASGYRQFFWVSRPEA